MGMAEDLQAWCDQQYQSQVSQLQSWWNSGTHHGCFCGAGAQCDQPVDDLDQLCKQHDDDYGAVGASADTMWTAEGFVRTRDADYALASRAGSAATTNTEFRDRLVWLFSSRYEIADGIIWYRQRLQELEEVRRRFQEWLLSASSLPAAQQHQELEQWMTYLEGQGVDRYESQAMVAASGFTPADSDGAQYA
jgi:hypothetical protein